MTFAVKSTWAEKPLHGQDTSLLNQELSLYGIFDGVGSCGPLAKPASQLASDTIHDYFKERLNTDPALQADIAMQVLKESFARANRAVFDAFNWQGQTTGLVFKLVTSNGDCSAVWGTAGDSRSFLFRKGIVSEISPEQKQGEFLANVLGWDRGKENRDEFGSLRLERGDRIMLCSDGITGDLDIDHLSEEEFQEAFGQTTIEQAADTFIGLSRAVDDKSVIVLEVTSK